MNRTGAGLLAALVRAARPWSLLAGILFYALGGGIAAYLGSPLDWPAYWLGQACVTLLQLTSYFLNEYFARVDQPPFRAPAYRPPPPPPPADDEDAPAARPPDPPVARVFFLQVAAATLTIGAVLTVLLFAAGALNPPVLLLIGMGFLIALLYAVPPVRLVGSGYGELAQAVLVANLFPALAFLLQTGELHRLLAMLTFPLTLLYLASNLALELQPYAEDVRRERRTLLVRLGWQRGMALHNLLVALAYITLALSVFAGLPGRLVLPAFLSLPLAIYQIVQINAIGAGARPRWKILYYTALAVVGLAAYFLNLALWTG